jgi:hypothetical protein
MGLRARFFKEVAMLGLPIATSPLPLVTETDLSPLLEAIQRYFPYADFELVP